MEEEERRAQIQIHRRRGEREPQIQIPPHLPHQSRIVVFISECMEVARAKKREQEGRRSLEVAAVALHSGGIEGAWVATGRGREGRRKEQFASGTTESAGTCTSNRSGSKTRGKSGDGNEE